MVAMDRHMRTMAEVMYPGLGREEAWREWARNDYTAYRSAVQAESARHEREPGFLAELAQDLWWLVCDLAEDVLWLFWDE